MNYQSSPAAFVIAVALLSSGSFVAAQSYSIPWSRIASGGSTRASTGSVFAVSGTIGQPDAGKMSGGNFSLAGGFWAGALVPTPGAPMLTAELLGANVRISWPLSATGFVLEHSAGLGTAWAPVATAYQTNNARISVTVPALGQRYYQLRKP